MGDSAYLAWVRTQPCSVCAAPGPNHAHHHTDGKTSVDQPRSRNALGGKRGRGQKADDTETMALCFKHHRQLHDFTGYFASFDNAQRRVWQDEQVRDHQARHALVPQLTEALAPARAVERHPDAFDTKAEIEALVETFQPGGGQLRFELVRVLRRHREAVEKGVAF